MAKRGKQSGISFEKILPGWDHLNTGQRMAVIDFHNGYNTAIQRNIESLEERLRRYHEHHKGPGSIWSEGMLHHIHLQLTILGELSKDKYHAAARSVSYHAQGRNNIFVRVVASPKG